MEFEAAHFIPDHPKCKFMHGHSYKVHVCYMSSELDDDGMVYDFHKMKEEMAKCIGKYDHTTLNDFMEKPTAENIAKKIHDDLKAMGLRSGKKIKPDKSSDEEVIVELVHVYSVEVFETSSSSAIYVG